MRIVIYTVLVGDKEALCNPLEGYLTSTATDLDIDFICFTDNENLKSNVWKFKIIDASYLPPEKASRRPKALPHEYLPEYTFSLYIDNTVSFKRLPNSQDLLSDFPYILRAYRHAYRDNPADEAGVIASLGYEDTNVICSQLDFYSRIRPISSINPMCTCSMILRTHNHPDVIEFGKIWWEQILAFSKRDQLSFDFSALQANCVVDHFPGFKHDNDIIVYPNKIYTHRVQANFDPVRYIWFNRDDPEARINPKAHYLAKGNRNTTDYNKRVTSFEYICYLVGSSLGNQISPRRGMASYIEAKISCNSQKDGSFLIIRVFGGQGDYAFSSGEVNAASIALATLLGFDKVQVLDVDINNIEKSNNLFENPGIYFNNLIFVGLSAQCLDFIMENFGGLLSPEVSSVTCLLYEEAGMERIEALRTEITKRCKMKCDVALSYSWHDGLNWVVDNSVVWIGFNSI